MQTLQLRVKLTSDHRINLTLPPDFPEGDVEITLRSAEASADASPPPPQQMGDLQTFFELIKTIPPTGRSTQEINHQIQEERGSWE